MYPIITIWSHVIDITGLSIIISLIVFLLSVYILVRKSRLQFVKFFYWFPLPIVLSYMLGGYLSFAMTHKAIIPTSITQRKMMLSPYDYHFHIIGILIAFTVSIWIFLRKMPSRHERRVWINIIASSISITMIPLGIWLVLGDHLIGLPTQSIRGAETFRPDISTWSDYGSIYPIGLYIAIRGLTTFIIQRLGQHMDRPSGKGYMTFALITLGLGFIRTFVNTPKYLVIQVGNMKRDITTYICLAIAGLFFQQYLIEKHRVTTLTHTHTSWKDDTEKTQ